MVRIRGMKRALTLAALFLVSGTAAAAWWPDVSPRILRVEVGQTRNVHVIARFSGMSPVPWRDWTIETTNAEVAAGRGIMKSSRSFDVPITGITPGKTFVRVTPGSDHPWAAIEVVCGKEDPIRPAEAQVAGTIGKPVTLEAVTPIAHRTTFVWYRGRVGDQSSPLPVSGPQIELIPQSTSETVWVLATTPCSTSSAEFLVTAHPSKRRSLRR